MQVLCIDSSSKSASVAVCREDVLLCESFLNVGLTHSQTLSVILEDILKASGISLQDIDLVAVSSGPGSFTGIRIGVSLAKGIAQALSIDCVGISTLEVLAEAYRETDAVLCPLMDARRDQFYNALFEGGTKFCRLTPDRAISAEELANELAQKIYKKKIILFGDGAEICYNNKNFNSIIRNSLELSEKTQTSEDILNDNLIIASPQHRLQRASCLGFAAIRAIKEGTKQPVSPAELRPKYLRKSQAERLRLEREGSKTI